MKWKPISQPPPMKPCDTFMGGMAKSDWLLVRFPHSKWDDLPPEVPPVTVAIAIQYEGDDGIGEGKPADIVKTSPVIEWFSPADTTGGLERCNSHGYPSVEAWCELPDG